MRTFTKSHKLDNVLYDVRGPVADEAARMEAAGNGRTEQQSDFQLHVGNVSAGARKQVVAGNRREKRYQRR